MAVSLAGPWRPASPPTGGRRSSPVSPRERRSSPAASSCSIPRSASGADSRAWRHRRPCLPDRIRRCRSSRSTPRRSPKSIISSTWRCISTRHWSTTTGSTRISSIRPSRSAMLSRFDLATRAWYRSSRTPKPPCMQPRNRWPAKRLPATSHRSWPRLRAGSWRGPPRTTTRLGSVSTSRTKPAACGYRWGTPPPIRTAPTRRPSSNGPT